MAFCSNCGAQLQDGEKFCSACGTPVEAAPQQAPQQEAPQAQGDQVDVSQKVKDFMNSGEDKTAQFTAEDITNNKAMAILAYFGILVLIPIFAAKDSKYARFHANQGLVLLIVDLILIIIGKIPIIGWIVGFVGGIALLVFAIMGIVAAAQGQAKTLPLVGKYTILK